MAESTGKEAGPTQKTTAVKATETGREASGLIKRYYVQAQEAAARGEPVAYLMVNSMPQEILLAMGIVAMYPENYATVSAAKHMNTSFLERAEGDGFPYYTCSYARTWLGYAARMSELGCVPPEAAWGGMPRPRMILGRTTCEPGYKGFAAMARYLDVPVLVYDRKSVRFHAGFAYEDPEVAKRYIENEKGQILAFVAFLEKHTGRKIQWDKVSEAIVRHHEARRLWHEIYELRKAVPCPIPVGDIASCMFPLYYMMGTEEGLNFYRKLYGEVKERVERRQGVIPDEKYRLLWGGIPQWHNLGFFNALESVGAVFAIDNQYYRDAFVEVDPGNPVEAIAKRTYGEASLFAARGRSYGGVGDWRAGLILELARDYHVDGAVLHLIFSCRPVSLGWAHVRHMLRQHLDLPTLALESDIADSRAHSEAQTKEQVNAFIETMETQRSSRGKAGRWNRVQPPTRGPSSPGVSGVNTSQRDG